MVHKCQTFADLLYASYSGLQTLAKWLKDRKGRKLFNADISHYKRIVRALRRTAALMSEIDKLPIVNGVA